MDAFDTFAKLLTSTGMRRSEPYRLGLAAKLRFEARGDRIPKLPFNEGTPELDAYYAGVARAEIFLEHLKWGVETEEVRKAWEAIRDLAASTRQAVR